MYTYKKLGLCSIGEACDNNIPAEYYREHYSFSLKQVKRCGSCSSSTQWVNSWHFVWFIAVQAVLGHFDFALKMNHRHVLQPYSTSRSLPFQHALLLLDILLSWEHERRLVTAACKHRGVAARRSEPPGHVWGSAAAGLVLLSGWFISNLCSTLTGLEFTPTFTKQKWSPGSTLFKSLRSPAVTRTGSPN